MEQIKIIKNLEADLGHEIYQTKKNKETEWERKQSNFRIVFKFLKENYKLPGINSDQVIFIIRFQLHNNQINTFNYLFFTNLSKTS